MKHLNRVNNGLFPDCQKDKELLKRFRVVLPVCNLCIASKKDIPKRLPIK
jgi:hypothetical protein